MGWKPIPEAQPTHLIRGLTTTANAKPEVAVNAAPTMTAKAVNNDISQKCDVELRLEGGEAFPLAKDDTDERTLSAEVKGKSKAVNRLQKPNGHDDHVNQ